MPEQKPNEVSDDSIPIKKGDSDANGSGVKISEWRKTKI